MVRTEQEGLPPLSAIYLQTRYRVCRAVAPPEILVLYLSGVPPAVQRPGRVDGREHDDAAGDPVSARQGYAVVAAIHERLRPRSAARRRPPAGDLSVEEDTR